MMVRMTYGTTKVTRSFRLAHTRRVIPKGLLLLTLVLIMFNPSSGEASVPIGTITTAAGNGVAIPHHGTQGVASTTVGITNPYGVALAPDRSLYIGTQGARMVYNVAANGILTVAAGNVTLAECSPSTAPCGDGGPATQARLYYPYSVATGMDGSLFIADTYIHRIRRVDTNGIITTVAGNGVPGFGGDGGLATQAQLNFPRDMVVTGDGTLYIADTDNHRIRKVDTNGVITTLAGIGQRGFSGDGHQATQAMLNAPQGLGLGPDGSLYLADALNFRVRRISTAGIITTVAGHGGSFNDGVPATEANLSSPADVAVAADGSFFIALDEHQIVRRVGTDGLITTVAGIRGAGCPVSTDHCGDTGDATQALLKFPNSVTVSPDGRNLYIADSSNYRVRRVEFPTILYADSVSDFSNVQGQDNWFYGYYATVTDPATFTLLEYFDSGTVLYRPWWEETPEQGPLTLLWRDGGHPGELVDVSTTPEHPAVRRWISEAASGQRIRIVGRLAKKDTTCGDGVVGEIRINGAIVWSAAITSNDGRGVIFDFLYGDDPGEVLARGDPVEFVLRRQVNDFCDSSIFTARIIVGNSTPTGEAGGPYSVAEGASVLLVGSGADPDGESLAYRWDLDNDGIFEETGQTPTFSAAARDGPESLPVFLQVCDQSNACHTSQATIEIHNQAPTLVLDNDGPIDEGSVATIMATASDPADAHDPLTYAFDCNDDELYETGYGTDSATTCSYEDDGSFEINVRVMDDDGGVTTASTIVVVRNIAPTANFSNTTGTINEGGTATFAFSDPFDPSSLDTAAGFLFSYDCTADGIVEAEAVTQASYTCPYPANGSYTIQGRISDRDGYSTEYVAHIIVNNVAPVVDTIMAPLDPVLVNTVVQTSAAYTDSGALDTHEAAWEWGDDTTLAGTVVEAGGSGQAHGEHAYASPGVYVVKLTVTDQDGDSGESLFQYIVVYDPNGGFVTGGGWIQSPAGAYVADPTLAGRANFGFVSKYQRGTGLPTGRTQFQFRAGGMNFDSNNYQWLVVSGARAQFKGEGTINDEGRFGFMLTAIDGQLNGGLDTLRLKIWDTDNNDALVYDNLIGAPDNANPVTAIGGGAIVIHR